MNTIGECRSAYRNCMGAGKDEQMRTTILASIDWSRGMWVVQYRDLTGNVVIEPTEFPASTPSIVVCDALLKNRPGSSVFAKIN